jgi:hypothetical protein
VKRLVLIALAVAAAVGVAPQHALAGQCGLPNGRPLWIDYADGSVPFWQTFAQPGVIAAAANFIFPPQLRAGGAKTVYWDMYLNRRVGTPSEPADPSAIAPRANRFFDYASASSACATPIIAENELFGANTLAPWSPSNSQYRANVLAWLQALAARGARPALLISSPPYTGGDAAQWWRQVAQVADIVREAYFPAPAIYQQGPIAGSRSLRLMFRQDAAQLLAIGIPPARIGLMLGFHTTPGSGGRERLQPAQAWFEVVKLQALAARQVAHELHLGSIWSWGWAQWKTLPGEIDPDKPAAACVYLWTRNPLLCDGPAAAGPGFDASRTEGQLLLPRGVRCTVNGQRMAWDAVNGIKALTGDEQAAFTAGYARLVAGQRTKVSTRRVLAAERLLIRQRFGGSRAAFAGALAQAHASRATALGAIADELSRLQIAPRLRVAPPASSQIEDYYSTYSGVQARLVRVTPAPSWLGRNRTGFALASTAPGQIFALRTRGQATIHTFTGTFKVRALGDAISLGAVPLNLARPSISAALLAGAHDDAYERWLVSAEEGSLSQTVCWRDQLPALAVIQLTDYLPFLSLDGGAVNG